MFCNVRLCSSGSIFICDSSYLCLPFISQSYQKFVVLINLFKEQTCDIFDTFICFICILLIPALIISFYFSWLYFFFFLALNCQSFSNFLKEMSFFHTLFCQYAYIRLSIYFKLCASFSDVIFYYHSIKNIFRFSIGFFLIHGLFKMLKISKFM